MRYLILGSTGTLGNATVIELLSRPDTKLIRCLSRDELKLSELKRRFKDPRVETVIGDIRDKYSIKEHFAGIDTVFHFAALKRIPEMEKQPLESLKTNVLGTINAAQCAIECNVKHFMFSSTDKATRPVNTYGACKFLSEQILFSMNKLNVTNFSVYRWVNVLASRGSVIYSFKDAIENNLPVEITNKEMTRGWIFIEDAVRFVLDTYQNKGNEIRIPPIKAAPILKLLSAIGTALGKVPAYVVTGIRPGEKLHEDLLYDMNTGACLSTNNCEQYAEDELLEIARGIVK